ncbi:MAG: DEAD/DEAH box helicase [Adlercreutzia equolifaciens]
MELWPHQGGDALMDLAVGDSVILGTPTGSGKSMVALGLCFMAVATGRTAYYTAPIKALVSEKFFDMVDILGRENVGMITGDSTINTEAPVICCTAEILANQALREGPASKVACVVMDEVPLLRRPRSRLGLAGAAAHAAERAVPADERHPRRRERHRRRPGGAHRAARRPRDGRAPPRAAVTTTPHLRNPGSHRGAGSARRRGADVHRISPRTRR